MWLWWWITVPDKPDNFISLPVASSLSHGHGLRLTGLPRFVVRTWTWIVILSSVGSGGRFIIINIDAPLRVCEQRHREHLTAAHSLVRQDHEQTCRRHEIFKMKSYYISHSELADNESSRLQQTVSVNIATATHFNFFKLTVGTIMTQVVAWTSKVNTTEMSTPEGLDPQLRRIVAWLEEFALRQFFFEVGMLVTHAHKIEVLLNLFFCCVLMKNILNSVF